MTEKGSLEPLFIHRYFEIETLRMLDNRVKSVLQFGQAPGNTERLTDATATKQAGLAEVDRNDENRALKSRYVCA